MLAEEEEEEEGGSKNRDKSAFGAFAIYDVERATRDNAVLLCRAVSVCGNGEKVMAPLLCCIGVVYTVY